MSYENAYDKLSEQTLLALADNMAASATSFNSHGYEIFINSREAFIKALHELYINNNKTQE